MLTVYKSLKPQRYHQTQWSIIVLFMTLVCEANQTTDSSNTSSSLSTKFTTFFNITESDNGTTQPVPTEKTESSPLSISTVWITGTTESELKISSTDEGRTNTSVWSVPFIVLVSVSSALLVICIVCFIVIWKLKKSLKKRSKLYQDPPEEEDHTYMDLGDNSIKVQPPVELKSVRGTQEEETKLPMADESPKGFRSYKDRKRKPVPPIPQSVVPSKTQINKEDVKEKEDKTKSTDQKRQNTSQKNKLPTYNNKVPLDVSDDNDEQDLYESYDHSLTNTESYTKEMIDDALNGMHETNIADVTVTQAEKQRQMSFESETSNKLRNAQGSFIVSEDAHHEGLAFTERQISFSGLPEVAVQYNANKGAESPLPLEGKQAAYENQAFEIIEENVLIKENNNQLRTTVYIDDTSKLPINKEGSTKTDTERAHNSASGTLLYGDEFVPDTESSEKADSDDLPLYEDAEENHITEPANDKQANDLPLYEDAEESPVKKSTDNTKLDNLPLYEDSAPGIPLYDDNFVPASAGLENGTIEALPVYENAVETKDKLPLSKQMLVANEGSKQIMNPASSGNDVLPIYEYAVDTDNAVPSTRPLLVMNKGSEQPSTALLVNSIPPYNTEIKQKEIINLNDLGDYEDCELSKLPIAPPPPMHGNLNQHTIKNEVGLADRQLPKMDTKEHLDEQLMTEKAITHETYAPPLPLRHDLKEPGITADNNHVLLKESNKSKNVSDAAEFCDNESVSKTVGGPVLSPGLTFEKLKSENITDLQSDHAKSAKLLDLSLAPEMKFRSGSKVDIFDEPGISSSSDAYFLDMNDLPSEIVENSNSDTSPIVDEEKPINISKTNNEVDRGKLLVPLFDNNMLKLEHSGNNETNVTNSYKMNSMNAECDTKDARSNISGNLLQCSNEQFQPVVPQAGSRSSALHNPKVKKNGDCNTLLQFEQVNKEYDDGDLYDIPPPNFPPPELKLN